MYNKEFPDIISMLDSAVGLANYDENETQNDKADIMNRLDEQTKEILLKVQKLLEEQNQMLRDILKKLH